MCVIVYQPSDNKDILPKQFFEHCAKTNPDGHGLMFCQNGILKIQKQLGNIDGFYEKYQQALAKTNGPVIIHFRIGTSGKKNLANTHPHFITPNIGLAHNGVLSRGTYKMSDTRLFIKNILQKLPESWFDNQTIMDLLCETISTDKIILLRNDGKHWILNENKGFWNKELGIWYSNYSADSWNKPRFKTFPKAKEKNEKEDTTEWWKPEDKKLTAELLEELDFPFFWNQGVYCIECIPTTAWANDNISEISGVHECTKCTRPLYAPINLRAGIYA